MDAGAVAEASHPANGRLTGALESTGGAPRPVAGAGEEETVTQPTPVVVASLRAPGVPGRLSSRVVPCGALKRREILAMRALLERHFEGVDASTFDSDLAGKTHAVLLEDPTARLRGFTTFHIGPARVDGSPLTVVYSGDTIVAPDAWGSTVLPRAWIRAVYHLRSALPPGELYWLLLTSGFRTYRFLSVFWRRFHPRFDGPTPARQRRLLDALSRERFGDRYDAEAGVVRFPRPQVLRPELIDVPEGRQLDPDVRFFLERNPGFIHGDELVSLTSLEPENLTAAGRRMLRSSG